jgi:hypothetical protein
MPIALQRGCSPTRDSPRSRFAIGGLGLLAAVLLAGCAAGPVQIYQDVLREAFSTPPDAEVSDAMLANTTFAYSHARIGDGPQMVLVLAYREFGEDKWVTAGGQMVVLRGDRIVRTVGLRTDLAGVSATAPDPVGRTTPRELLTSQWEAVLDWAGQAGAGYRMHTRYRDHGLEAVELRSGDSRELHLVEERVRLEPGDIRYSNWFALDESGRVVRSQQQVHPDSKPLTLTFIRRPPEDTAPLDAAPSSADAPAPDAGPGTGPAAGQPDRVTVTLADGRRIALPPGPQRLESLLLATGNISETWWPAARLYRSDAVAVEAARQARTALSERLVTVARRALVKGHVDESEAIERLAETLPPAAPGEWLPLVLDPDRVRLDISLNKLMPPGEYLLLAPGRPVGLQVTGLVRQGGPRLLVAGRGVAEIVAAEQHRAGADRDVTWLIQPEGEIARVPVAFWNREHVLPRAGATLLFGLDPDLLPRRHADLNHELARFYASQPVETRP